MLDAPVDIPYLWVGVAVASLAALGIVIALPATAPPDPQPVAATVDTVATSPYEATGHYPLDATAVKLDSQQVGLRVDGTTAHAEFDTAQSHPSQPKRHSPRCYVEPHLCRRSTTDSRSSVQSSEHRTELPSGHVLTGHCSSVASSGRTPMSRSSAYRGQVEPLAALVALFAVGAGLAVYAGAVDERLPEQSPASPDPTLDSVEQAVSTGGVVEPGRLSAAQSAAPSGHELNVTVTTAEDQWQVGPTPPTTARAASARVSVKTAPGSVRPGRLTVRVWP